MDTTARVWTIPAPRMKANREHWSVSAPAGSNRASVAEDGAPGDDRQDLTATTQ